MHRRIKKCSTYYGYKSTIFFEFPAGTITYKNEFVLAQQLLAIIPRPDIIPLFVPDRFSSSRVSRMCNARTCVRKPIRKNEHSETFMWHKHLLKNSAETMSNPNLFSRSSNGRIRQPSVQGGNQTNEPKNTKCVPKQLASSYNKIVRKMWNTCYIRTTWTALFISFTYAS